MDKPFENCSKAHGIGRGSERLLNYLLEIGPGYYYDRLWPPKEGEKRTFPKQDSERQF